MENVASKETFLAGELFTELFNKFNKMQNKKHMYKDMKELTLIEINTIIVIGRDNMKSMSEIANTLGVSFGTPTVTIDRLITKDYVVRIRDEEDRRQVFVKLSEKGIEVYNAIFELKSKATETIFSILSQEEKVALISILAKLNHHLDGLFNA